MKKILSLILAFAMIISMVTVSFAEGKTPAELGFSTDDDNFTGWEITDAENFKATTGTQGNSRIFKTDLISDKNNFHFTATVQPDYVAENKGNAGFPQIKVLGSIIEGDCRNGNGNQVFMKAGGQNKDWINAQGCKFTVDVERKDGGSISVTFKGEGNPQTATYTMSADDGAWTGVEFYTYGHEIEFTNVKVISGSEPEQPGGEIIKKDTSTKWGDLNGLKVDENDTMLFLEKGNSGQQYWTDFPSNAAGYDMTVGFHFDDALENIGDENHIWYFMRDEFGKVNGAQILYHIVRMHWEDGRYVARVYAQMFYNNEWINTNCDIVKFYDNEINDIILNIVHPAASTTFTVKTLEKGGAQMGSAVIDSDSFSGNYKSVFDAYASQTPQVIVRVQNNVSNVDGMCVVTNPVFNTVSSGTPGDFGWYTDNNNFTGWSAADAANFEAAAGAASNRVWKPIFKDYDNFHIKLTVQGEYGENESQQSHPVVRLLGNNIELDARHGNGNEVYVKLNNTNMKNTASGDWLKAANCRVEFDIERRDGGDINVVLSGANGDFPVKFTMQQLEQNENIELKADGNAVKFTGFSISAPEVPEEVQFTYSRDNNWKAIRDENGLAFITVNQNGGLLKYNNTLKANGNLQFGYDVNALELVNNSAGLAWHLQFVDSPQQEMFTRLNVTGDNQINLKGELWDAASSKWTTVYGSDNWSTETFKDGLVRVLFTITSEKFNISLLNKDNEVKVSYDVTEGISDLFTSDTIRLILQSESGKGLIKVSNFVGLPEIESPDFHKDAFEKIAVIGTDTIWKDSFKASVATYQNKEPEMVFFDKLEDCTVTDADLYIFADAAKALGGGFDSYMSALTDFITVNELYENKPVYLVNGLTAMQSGDITKVNAHLRYMADNTSRMLFANMLNAYGTGAVKTDAELEAGEMLHQLMRNCTCLAVNATKDLNVSRIYPAEVSAEALEAFKNAGTFEDMLAAVTDEALGANLDIFRNLNSKNQTAVINALLLENRADIATAEEADELIETAVIESNTMIPLADDFTIGTWVAVGDSITVGETSVNKQKDAWVPQLKTLLEKRQGTEINLINKAISGTRMCTRTDNDMFPPASETVDEYIVANNPDFITIAYGINDVNAGTDLNTFITTYRAYLTEITEKCPDAKIVVFGMGPMWNDSKGAQIRAWNAAIKELAESFDLTYAETYYDTVNTNWLLTDGLHPTNAGYRVIANAAYRAIVSYEQPEQYSVYVGCTVGQDITVNIDAVIPDKTAAQYDSFKAYIKAGEAGEERALEAEIKENTLSFSYNVPMPEMAETVILRVVGVNNSQETVLINNIDFSVLQYCDRLHEMYFEDEEMVKFLANMIEYGAQCQLYLNPETPADRLANKAQWISGSITKETPVADVQEKDISSGFSGKSYIKSAGLKISDKIAIYFTVAAGIEENLKLTVSAQGMEDQIFDINNKTTISLEKILPTQYDTVYTAVLSSGSTVLHTVKYSVNTYAARMNNKQGLNAITTAIYNYGLASKTDK